MVSKCNEFVRTACWPCWPRTPRPSRSVLPLAAVGPTRCSAQGPLLRRRPIQSRRKLQEADMAGGISLHAVDVARSAAFPHKACASTCGRWSPSAGGWPRERSVRTVTRSPERARRGRGGRPARGAVPRQRLTALAARRRRQPFSRRAAVSLSRQRRLAARAPAARVHHLGLRAVSRQLSALAPVGRAQASTRSSIAASGSRVPYGLPATEGVAAATKSPGARAARRRR